MSELNPQPNDDLHEQLVSYLDGELSIEQSRRIEERLSTDDTARDELRRLEKVWDVLDGLPRSQVNETFARTTVEMVALAAEKDLKQEHAARPRRQIQTWLAASVAVLLAGVVGFAGAALFFPDRNGALLRDLPVIENFEMLQKAENVAFLKRLAEEGAFLSESDLNGTASVAAADTAIETKIPAAMDGRRSWVEQLGESDRDHLQRMQDRFAVLSPEEQNRLRELQGQLESSAELRRVLHHYYEWLKNLDPAQRADVLALGSDKRIDGIRKLKEQQAAQSLRNVASNSRFKNEDWKKMSAWFDLVVQSREAQLLKDMTSEQRQRVEELPQSARRGALMFTALGRWNGTIPGAMPPIEMSEIEKLLAELSPDAQAQLNSSPNKPQAVLEMARHATRSRFFQGRWGQPGQPINLDEVGRMMAGLPVDEQEKLRKLPPDEMQRELRKQYYDRLMVGLPTEEQERLRKLPPEEMQRELRKIFPQKRRPGDGPPPFKFGERPNGDPPDAPPGSDVSPPNDGRPPRDRSNNGPRGDRLPQNRPPPGTPPVEPKENSPKEN